MPHPQSVHCKRLLLLSERKVLAFSLPKEEEETMSASLLRHIFPHSRRRRRLPLQYSLLPLAILSLTAASSMAHSNNQFDPFPGDILTPYPEGRHGGTRTTREISSCQHTRWENRTVETFKVSTTPPSGDGKLKFKMHKYADVVARTPLRKRYAVGTITFIEDPYYTLSVLEPSRKGTCHQKSYYTTKATVLDTATNYKHGCRLAANGGYFTVSNGNCLGNIVSDGQLVKSANGVQNANFGIKEDGSIVVGYIPEEELRNQTNPFRQLVTGEGEGGREREGERERERERERGREREREREGERWREM